MKRIRNEANNKEKCEIIQFIKFPSDYIKLEKIPSYGINEIVFQIGKRTEYKTKK